MKLSQLISYRNLLRTKEFDPEYGAITGRLDHIVHTVQNHKVQFPSCTKDVALHSDNVRRAIKGFHRELETLKVEIETQIARQERSYYQQSLRWFIDESPNETTDYILDRRLKISDADKEVWCNRIRSHSDWRLPGMVLRPGKEDFIDIMVALDPLYVVDLSEALLQPAVSHFPDMYQIRVRQYVINDKTDDKIFDRLPKGQFGLIFAYSYFNFLPMEMINRYLAESMELLRPGGTIIFTYNDCDREESVGSVENHFMCYTPGGKIQQMAKELGFEIERNVYGDHGLAWFEMRRPGKVSSMRGAQTLAKIYRI
jgi:hypothetical protein